MPEQPAWKGTALDAPRQGTPDWEIVNEHHLRREFRFPDFATALAFVNRVGAVAEAANHHPDIALSWGRVEVTTYTHTIDGLGPKDFALAKQIDALAR